MSARISSGFFVRFLVLISLSSLWVHASLAQPSSDKTGPRESYTYIKQFYAEYPKDMLGALGHADFETSVRKHCSDLRAAALPTALGAVLIDWLAGRAVSAANKRLDRYIKEHTTTFSTTPSFYDIGEAKLWAPGPDTSKPEPKHYETCVMVTRINCPKGVDPLSSSPECKTHLRFAAILRDKTQHLRVLPIALAVEGLEARHSKGNASVAVNFEIEAISHSNRGGQRWSSGDIALIAEEFDGKKANPKKGEYGDTKHFVGFPITEEDWGTAPILPMPPNMRRPNTEHNQSVAAFKVTVAEVGKPSAFGKRLADLLSTKKDDLSGALGSALKKAAGVDEE